MVKRLLILAFTFVIILGTSPAFADTMSDWGIDPVRMKIPALWVDAFNQNVQSMGENKAAFDQAFRKLNSDEKKRAGVFLVAFMPLVDLVAMDADTFVTNIDYAFKARDEYPWGKDYDEETFYMYVLPHRVSQEPIENFRPFFSEKLKDRMKGIKALNEAALAVNKWCDEVIEYKPTQSRDQGPFETLKSGYGRCEEMMIFFIDAARSVGIPARQAYTPYWAHSDDNHAWAEVYAFGRWNFLGACESADKLDEAWFKNPAKRAALVMSIPFGLPDKATTKEEIYRYEDKIPDKYAIINSTKFYAANPVEIEIVALDKNDQPLTDVNVLVYVFNYGALRPIARMRTDGNGMAKLTIGEGRYFFSAGTEQLGGGKIVTVIKGKTKTIKIKQSEAPVLDGYNWMRPAKG